MICSSALTADESLSLPSKSPSLSTIQPTTSGEDITDDIGGESSSALTADESLSLLSKSPSLSTIHPTTGDSDTPVKCELTDSNDDEVVSGREDEVSVPLEVVGGGTDTTATSPAPEIVAGEESSTTLDLSSVLPVGLLSDVDEDEEETLSVVELPLETSPSDTDLSTFFPLGLFSDDEDDQEEVHEEGGAPQPSALACGVLADHATPSSSDTDKDTFLVLVSENFFSDEEENGDRSRCSAEGCVDSRKSPPLPQFADCEQLSFPGQIEGYSLLEALSSPQHLVPGQRDSDSMEETSASLIPRSSECKALILARSHIHTRPDGQNQSQEDSKNEESEDIEFFDISNVEPDEEDPIIIPADISYVHAVLLAYGFVPITMNNKDPNSMYYVYVPFEKRKAQYSRTDSDSATHTGNATHSTQSTSNCSGYAPTSDHNTQHHSSDTGFSGYTPGASESTGRTTGASSDTNHTTGAGWDTHGSTNYTPSGTNYTSGAGWGTKHTPGAGWDTHGSTNYTPSGTNYTSGAGWGTKHTTGAGWDTHGSTNYTPSGTNYTSGAGWGTKHTTGAGWDTHGSTDYTPSGTNYTSGADWGTKHTTGAGWDTHGSTDYTPSGTNYTAGAGWGTKHTTGAGWDTHGSTDYTPSGTNYTAGAGWGTKHTTGAGWDTHGSTDYTPSGTNYTAGAGWGTKHTTGAGWDTHGSTNYTPSGTNYTSGAGWGTKHTTGARRTRWDTHGSTNCAGWGTNAGWGTQSTSQPTSFAQPSSAETTGVHGYSYTQQTTEPAGSHQHTTNHAGCSGLSSAQPTGQTFGYYEHPPTCPDPSTKPSSYYGSSTAEPTYASAQAHRPFTSTEPPPECSTSQPSATVPPSTSWADEPKSNSDTAQVTR